MQNQCNAAQRLSNNNKGYLLKQHTQQTKETIGRSVTSRHIPNNRKQTRTYHHQPIEWPIRSECIFDPLGAKTLQIRRALVAQGVLNHTACGACLHAALLHAEHACILKDLRSFLGGSRFRGRSKTQKSKDAPCENVTFGARTCKSPTVRTSRHPEDQAEGETLSPREARKSMFFSIFFLRVLGRLFSGF